LEVSLCDAIKSPSGTHAGGATPAAAASAALERELTLALGTTPEFDQAQSMRAFPPAKHDALGLEELLTQEEREVRDRVRAFAVSWPGWAREGWAQPYVAAVPLSGQA
jgi:hypothetical protein